MENAILIVHLVLVVFLVAIVLLQRSEGGALGMGGGGGGGVMTGRGAATALQRATWYIAAGFLVTSLTLTILATTERRSGSVFDEAVPDVYSPMQDGEPPVTFVPPTIEGDAPAGDTPVPVPSTGAGASDADPDNLVPVPAPE